MSDSLRDTGGAGGAGDTSADEAAPPVTINDTTARSRAYAVQPREYLRFQELGLPNQLAPDPSFRYCAASTDTLTEHLTEQMIQDTVARPVDAAHALPLPLPLLSAMTDSVDNRPTGRPGYRLTDAQRKLTRAEGIEQIARVLNIPADYLTPERRQQLDRVLDDFAQRHEARA